MLCAWFGRPRSIGLALLPEVIGRLITPICDTIPLRPPPKTPTTHRWVLGPAITLLLVMAISVGVVYQNNVAARPPDTPTLGSAQQPTPAGGQGLTAAIVGGGGGSDDSKTVAALDDTIEAPTPVADDDTSSTVDPVVDDDDDADAAADKPGPKMNATAVLSCLEDKCEPLVTQLGKTWRELGALSVRACVRAGTGRG